MEFSSDNLECRWKFPATFWLWEKNVGGNFQRHFSCERKMSVEISIQFSFHFFFYETSGKVHANFHVPCNEIYGKVFPYKETHGKVHGNLPCDTYKQTFPHLMINCSRKSWGM